MSISPASVTRHTRSSMPRLSSRSICQGTILAWCSSSLISTAWPGFITPRPQEWATRFIASVLFLVNTIFARIAGVDEARGRLTRGLIGVGGEFAQPIGAAMDIGVGGFHAADHGVDHRARLLRAGAAVEEHQRPAALRLRQDREILADAGDVEAGLGQAVHHAAAPWRCHQESTARVRAARNVSSVTVSTASCRKASTSIARACGSGMPRARR